jgi:hypothetical protein
MEKIIFRIFELFLFIMPIIPSSINIRLLIMLFYFISHMYGVQNSYVTFKKSYLKYKTQLLKYKIKNINITHTLYQ